MVHIDPCYRFPDFGKQLEQMTQKPTKLVQMKLRVPHSIHRLIEDAAHEGRRSLNQEVIMRLEQSLNQDVTAVAIQIAASSAAREVDKNNGVRLAALADAFGAILIGLGRADLAERLKSNSSERGQNG